MPSIRDLLKAIQQGMRDACEDSVIFTNRWTDEIAAEYLLTVNVAKNIGKLNTFYGDPYVIQLECSTKEFAANCFPLVARIPVNEDGIAGMKSVIRERHHNTSRNGRIDVAVFDEDCSMRATSLCAIELKGFNPSQSVVIGDLARNAEYFSQTSQTGRSSLLFTAFGSIESRKNAFVDQENLEGVLARYSTWMSKIVDPGNFDAEVGTFTVRIQAKEPGIDSDTGGPDWADDENHHFIGVLVVFTPKNGSKDLVREILSDMRGPESAASPVPNGAKTLS